MVSVTNDPSVRSTVRRAHSDWASLVVSWYRYRRYDVKQVPKIKKKRLFDSVEQGQERTTQKRTDVSQIFDIFAPKNCDQKVTKFCSEKNLLVGKKEKKSPRRTDARVQPF